MTIYNQIKQDFSGDVGREFTTAEIKQRIQERYGSSRSSVIPSDYCYNRQNEGVSNTRHLFEYLGRARYRYLGEGHRYTGQVFSCRRGTKKDQLVGEWRDGEYSSAP